MQDLSFNNYHSLDSYCKSERMNTEYFIYEMSISKGKKTRRRKLDQIILSIFKI